MFSEFLAATKLFYEWSCPLVRWSVVDYFHFVIQSHYCRSGHAWSLIIDPLTAGTPTQKVGSMSKAPKLTCWHMTETAVQRIYFSYIFLWWHLSVCLSVHHTFFYVPVIVSLWNFQELLPLPKVMSLHCKRSWSEVKSQGHRGQNKFCPNLGFSGL